MQIALDGPAKYKRIPTYEIEQWRLARADANAIVCRPGLRTVGRRVASTGPPTGFPSGVRRLDGADLDARAQEASWLCSRAKGVSRRFWTQARSTVIPYWSWLTLCPASRSRAAL